MTAIDDAMFVSAAEHRRMVGRSARLERVAGAVECHAGNADLGLVREPRFKRIQVFLARFRSQMEAIAMDDNIDKVGVVE